MDTFPFPQNSMFLVAAKIHTTIVLIQIIPSTHYFTFVLSLLL